MSRLSTYIKKIDSQRPINLTKFYNVVDSLKLTHRRIASDVEATKEKGQLYIINRINTELMDELRALVNHDGKSRATAALQNRSHSVNVNGSFLLIRGQSGDPSVVMIDRDGEHRCSVVQSKEALVIENRQNFIDVDEMIKFLEKHMDFNLSPSMNIIFSEGNQICNVLHQKFLSKYSHLHLCMDVDLGGLTIAKNLMSLLSTTTVSFLIPDDIERRLDDVVQRVDNRVIDEVVKIGLSIPALERCATLIKDKQKTLEQESYLHGQ